MSYANKTQNTKTLESTKFEYYAEDCACRLCLYYRKNSAVKCKLKTCCCEDIRKEAVAAGRIKRPPDWNSDYDN